MKTIKIPDSYKPTYNITINNVDYSFPAGATISVKDEIAEIIANDLGAVLEPAPLDKTTAEVARDVIGETISVVSDYRDIRTDRHPIILTPNGASRMYIDCTISGNRVVAPDIVRTLAYVTSSDQKCEIILRAKYISSGKNEYFFRKNWEYDGNFKGKYTCVTAEDNGDVILRQIYLQLNGEEGVYTEVKLAQAPEPEAES